MAATLSAVELPGPPTARPPGVTYACALSIALGALGIFGGLLAMMASGLWALIPFVGVVFASMALLFAVALLMMGGAGLVAGIAGLQGRSWARWAMVVLLALGAVVGWALLLLPIANGVAIWFLVNEDANAWFGR